MVCHDRAKTFSIVDKPAIDLLLHDLWERISLPFFLSPPPPPLLFPALTYNVQTISISILHCFYNVCRHCNRLRINKKFRFLKLYYHCYRWTSSFNQRFENYKRILKFLKKARNDSFKIVSSLTISLHARILCELWKENVKTEGEDGKNAKKFTRVYNGPFVKTTNHSSRESNVQWALLSAIHWTLSWIVCSGRDSI